MTSALPSFINPVGKLEKVKKKNRFSTPYSKPLHYYIWIVTLLDCKV